MGNRPSNLSHYSLKIDSENTHWCQNVISSHVCHNQMWHAGLNKRNGKTISKLSVNNDLNVRLFMQSYSIALEDLKYGPIYGDCCAFHLQKILQRCSFVLHSTEKQQHTDLVWHGWIKNDRFLRGELFLLKEITINPVWLKFGNVFIKDYVNIVFEDCWHHFHYQNEMKSALSIALILGLFDCLSCCFTQKIGSIA